jgi:hypothetical protein
MIEVPHEAEVIACIKAVQILLETGSHFLTKADFGCKDGVHKAWIIVDVDDKQEARMILPRPYREKAKITKLNYFSLQELEELRQAHQG